MLTSEVKSFLKASGKPEYRPFLFEESDTFKRRSEDAGAGNAFNPESFFHGSEIMKGLEGERDWANEQFYLKACQGLFAPTALLQIAPRTVKPVSKPEATFTLTIGPVSPVEPADKKQPVQFVIRAIDPDGREVTELTDEATDIMSIASHFAWVVRQWQGAHSRFGQHMKLAEDAKMTRLREMTE